MKNALLIILFLVLTKASNACCGAGQTRVFPLGTIGDQPICAVFQLTRDCRRGEFVFHEWFGKVTLETWNGTSFTEISKVDTVSFLECECTPDTLPILSDYLKQMEKHLLKAYQEANKVDGFLPFRTDIILIDSLEIDHFGFTKTDENLFFKAKKVLAFDAESLMCDRLDGIKEMRSYSNSKGQWAIITLGCYDGNNPGEKLIEESKRNFKKINTSVTYVDVEWHGYTKDNLIRLE